MTTEALAPLISALQERGEDRFDPVRFHYIQSLAQRSLSHSTSVSRMLETKTREAIAAYRADFTQAQEQAALVLERAATRCPAREEALQHLFERCEFKALQRLARQAESAARLPDLAALTARIDGKQPASDEDQPLQSLDDQLRQQEFDALQTATDAAGKPRPAAELKAARRLRASLKKRSGDKLVAQALGDIPQDSGPLNPQRLVLHSLETMRELSPQYLNRFVGYMDTLLWLQQSADDS